MDFKEYMSIKRFGTTEVEGIDVGTCYIFPKIDGTNASAWIDVWNTINGGSRRRHLAEGKDDNAGFREWLQLQDNIAEFFFRNPSLRLYGEWLVPHSLKTYREDAWRRFYVFDVARSNEDKTETLLPYDEYQPLLEEFGLDYIAPLGIIDNPSYDSLVHYLELNNFLIQDGKGSGEGIVIKNYGFINEHGRQTWAKIVTSDFKDKHRKEMGAPTHLEKNLIEKDIAEKYTTKALCEKTYDKIRLEKGGFDSRMIPQLLMTTYYDVVREDAWEFVKEHKFPKIDFRRLQHFVYAQVKVQLPKVF